MGYAFPVVRKEAFAFVALALGLSRDPGCGDVDDPNSNVSRLVAENAHFRMHEELGTGPRFYYLYDRARADDDPAEATPAPAVEESLA